MIPFVGGAMTLLSPRCRLLIVALSALVIPSACSRQSYRDGFGQIQGTITFKSQPLSGGTIHFFQDQEKVGSFMIRGDGTYAAEIPLGTVKAAIETVTVKYQDRAGREAVLKIMKENGFDVDPDQRNPKSPAFTGGDVKYVDIPEQYRDPEKSGLECKVVRGQQTCNFDLK
jgi:hypothetical protein